MTSQKHAAVFFYSLLGLVGLAHVLVNTCTRLRHFPRRAIFSAFRRPAGCVPTRICVFLGTGTHARHTRQHPSSHLQDCMNNTNTIQYCRKWCQTSSLTSCVPPVGLFPVAFDKEICDACFQVFSGLDKYGAATHRQRTRKARNSCFRIIYLTIKCRGTGQFDGQIMLINGNVG